MPFSPEWISAIGSVFTSLAATIGGWAALQGVGAWRAEVVGRRKTELAEEVLAQFYQARDAIAWARFPHPDPNGAETTPGADKAGVAVPVERLAQESRLFSELQASRYRFMAYFGESAARPFEEIRSAHAEVITSADRLARSGSAPSTARSAAQRDLWEDAIGWGEPSEDALARRVDAAIHAIEKTCRPLIDESRKRSRLAPKDGWRRWFQVRRGGPQSSSAKLATSRRTAPGTA